MTAGGEVAFFDELGIANVVWLDDLFDAKTTLDEVTIVEGVATAMAAGTVVPHHKLADLTATDSAQEWARRMQERLDPAEISEYLRQISPPPVDAAMVAPDYSAGELEAVVASLSATIRRVGFDRWPEAKDELIAAGTSGVFLVDRESLVAGERITVGDDIVRELIRRCAEEVLVLVLTHSVGPDSTEVLRRSLAEELGIPAARLGVVSKRPKGTSLATGIRSAVRIALTELTCAVVTARIATVMKKSLTDTEADLRRLPVQALDRAVFENSLEEGASEIDVLCRILSSRQRTAVDAHVAGALEDIHSPLARMRTLRLLEPLPQLPGGDASLLVAWRKDEVFDAGSRLNRLRSPMACGDVFQKDGTQNHFVLLGQPCDLTVRGDGQRGVREAMLVKLRATYPAPASEGRYLKVPALSGDAPWALDFRNWVSVNLECLEWASFNDDGHVAFSPSPRAPKGLLPGWEQRFLRAGRKFKEGRQYCLSLGGIPDAVATASAKRVAFPYHRVARLRAPIAAGAYAAFAAFHARGAFDHDFARGLEEPADPQARMPPSTVEGE